MKLSAHIPQRSFSSVRSSTQSTAHAQNVGMFKLISCRPFGSRWHSLVCRNRVAWYRPGTRALWFEPTEDIFLTLSKVRVCFCASGRVFFFLAVAPFRLYSLVPSFGSSITFVLRHCRTGQTHDPGRYYLFRLPLFFSFFFSSPARNLSAPTRGQTHNRCRISQDNHCGATGKCSKSKQRNGVCVCVCLCAHVCV